MTSTETRPPQAPALRRARPLTAAGQPSTSGLPSIISAAVSTVNTSRSHHKRASSLRVRSTPHKDWTLGLTKGKNTSLSHTLRRTLTGVKKSISVSRERADFSTRGAIYVGHNGTPRHGRSMSENLGRIRRDGEIAGLRNDQAGPSVRSPPPATEGKVTSPQRVLFTS